MTDIYFAIPQVAKMAYQIHNSKQDTNEPINVLASFHYLEKNREYLIENRAAFNKLMLDSGAYTAWSIGVKVDIDALIKECANPFWTEAVGLDVIGSSDGSKKNLDYMKSQGCTKAMPVFHYGDDWSLLDYYKQGWNKIGLSCRFGESLKESHRFYRQCFARAWPHKFHSFGWCTKDLLAEYPFHSADSSSWCNATLGFGSWRKYGKLKNFRKAQGAFETVRTEVLIRLEEQSWLKTRWKREMTALENSSESQATSLQGSST